MRFSRRELLLGCLTTFAAACTHGIAGDAPYSVGVLDETNRVTVKRKAHAGASGHDTDGYVVMVESARGIGEATIAWWGNTSPHPLSFRLYLSGLEQFRLKWAEHVVTVSVNSSDKSVIQTLHGNDGSEVAIGPESPYWIDVTSPTVAQEGYSLATPAAFSNDNPSVWSIAWVDFFR